MCLPFQKLSSWQGRGHYTGWEKGCCTPQNCLIDTFLTNLHRVQLQNDLQVIAYMIIRKRTQY